MLGCMRLANLTTSVIFLQTDSLCGGEETLDILQETEDKSCCTMCWFLSTLCILPDLENRQVHVSCLSSWQIWWGMPAFFQLFSTYDGGLNCTDGGLLALMKTNDASVFTAIRLLTGVSLIFTHENPRSHSADDTSSSCTRFNSDDITYDFRVLFVLVIHPQLLPEQWPFTRCFNLFRRSCRSREHGNVENMQTAGISYIAYPFNSSKCLMLQH